MLTSVHSHPHAHGLDRQMRCAYETQVQDALQESCSCQEANPSWEATLNLNAMNQKPNPWHVSFSYARALQNSVLKTWKVRPLRSWPGPAVSSLCSPVSSPCRRTSRKSPWHSLPPWPLPCNKRTGPVCIALSEEVA